MAGFKQTTLFRTLASPRLTLALLLVFGVVIAVATFIESARGTEAARIFVYDALWFELMLALFCLNLIFALGRWWPWRPRLTGFVLIHLAVIVILVGAGISRFFGYEGTMFIREGARSDTIYARGHRIWLASGGRQADLPVRLYGGGPRGKRLELPVDGDVLVLEVMDYDPAYGAGMGMGDGREAITVSVTDGAGESMSALVLRNAASLTRGKVGGRAVAVGFGSLPLEVPFGLALDDFVVVSYPGSDNPVSFESHVRLYDAEKGLDGVPHLIQMNHPLSHRGFKVFQSSYDDDKRGTVLTVNFDPGKVPTYVGYTLITLGFVLVFAKDLLWPPRRESKGEAS